MRARALGRAAAILAAVASPARGATLDVLFTAGQTASDGVHLQSIAKPLAMGTSAVVFRGGTSALLVKSGSTFTVVARAGDPLPAPLTGTFVSFSDPVINDSGAAAFRADLDSSSGSSASFLWEGGALRRIDSSNRLPVDVNAAGDVLLQTNTSLSVWTRGTGTLATPLTRTTAAPGIRRFTRFGRRAVLSDSGRVVFQAQFTRAGSSGNRRGVFTLAAGTITSIALEGDPAPTGGVYGRARTRNGPGEALSVNAAGDVAFTMPLGAGTTAPAGVFVFHPAAPTAALVAHVGDVVGGTPLTSVPQEYAGIDSIGRVAFKGCFSNTSCSLVLFDGVTLTALTGNVERTTAGGGLLRAGGFAPRLSDVGHVVWTSGENIERYDGAVTEILGAADQTPLGTDLLTGIPSMNAADTVAFRASREALYQLENGTPRPVASGGDAVGTVTIHSLIDHAVGGATLAFAAEDRDGLPFLALRRGGTTSRLVGEGDATPLGGTFVLSEGDFDVDEEAIVFAASIDGGSAATGLFRVHGSGTIETLARAGDAAPEGGKFAGFGAPLVDGRRIVFAATLDDDRQGLYALRGQRLGKLARTGDRFGGRRARITALGQSAADRNRVLFALTTTRAGALVLAAGRATEVVARGGQRVREVGRLDGGFPGFALGARGVAFLATLQGSTPPEALFLVRGGRRRTLAVSGRGVDLTVSDGSLSLAGADVVFLAGLPPPSDGVARPAVLRARP